MPVAHRIPFALLACAACVACAAALEVCQRAFDPIEFLAPTPPRSRKGPGWTETVHRRSQRAGVLYEMAPSVDTDVAGVGVRTNSLGFRGPEPPPRAAGRTRVAALGDSLTFGYLVAEAESWPALLGDALQRAPEPADVLNLGVCGYSTRDEAALLAARWDEIDLDVLVLGYCLNDPDIEPWQPLQRHFLEVRWWQHSHVLRRVARRLQKRRYDRYGGGDVYRYLHAEEGPCWPSVPEALGRIAELAGARDAPRLLVIFPVLLRRPWPEYPYADLHAQVRRAAEERGFEVLDLLEAFAERPVEELLASDGFHFNAAGHALAAARVREALRTLAAPAAVR